MIAWSRTPITRRTIVDAWAAGPAPAVPPAIVRNLAICVTLQLSLTIVFPGQGWSMPSGMVGLCLIGAAATWQLGRQQSRPEPIATNLVTAIFVLWALMWVALIYENHWRPNDQFLSCLLSLTRQMLLILYLVPRGGRSGERWPVVLDVILGIVLCGVLTTTLWPHALDGQMLPPEAFQFCLGHGIYAILAVSSYVVQRRAPPIFLKAFAITQCIYSATSIASVPLSAELGWADNSPLWIYGDAALVAYPLIASLTMRDRPAPAAADAGSMAVDPAPNQIVPLFIALVVLCLAFGSAQRQQVLAAVAGVAGVLVYAVRVAFVTRRYHQARGALVAAARQRVEALIDVVHELRSPLASVVLNAAALARDTDISAPLKPRIDAIADRCGTVTRLLNDVLDLERIEAGVMEISLAPIDVTDVCRNAVRAAATTADAAGVLLHGPGEDATSVLARGDAGLLARVVVNLLDNAVRFTPAGGCVTLSIGPAGSSQVALVIDDSGIGLSPAARATLFERFGHVADPVNGTKGAGLGLSISASAIAAMGGRLTVAARHDGPGTRATILLRRGSGR